MKKIGYQTSAVSAIALSVALLLGPNMAAAFDESLLVPEVLPMNTPRDVEPYADPAVLENLAPIRARFENLAVTEPADTINPRATSFAQQMPKTIYEPVANRAFLMAGWQLTSTLIVVGSDGLIVVDPGENDAASEQIMADFREATGIDLPVTAVVYSHRHPDHSFGSAGLGVTQEAVDDGTVRIFAHHEFMEYLANDASVVGDILSARTAYGAASSLGQNAEGMVHGGLGPTFTAGEISFYAPTDTVEDELEVEVSGVRMVLFEAYGDAEDEIDIYFPDLRHVHGSETIQGESFPNLYTLRGTKYRDMVSWYKGVDRLLSYAEQSDSYSHSHMRSWVGTDFITERIRNYRDAIQYVHDQSVRHINKGATREELVGLISLPESLANDPWLQEFYGSVGHVVQNVYGGYLGWYSGDATELARPEFTRRARLYVSAMGGRDAVLDIARAAIAAEDYGWAMDITTHLVRADPSDTEARQIKADAMRAWGYDQANIYYRNFALTGAAELDGSLSDEGVWNFADPVIIRQFSVGTILENLRVKLDGERAATGDVSIGFVISDRDEEHAFTVRNGVAVYETDVPSDANVVVTLPSSVVYDFVLGQGTLRDAVENGTATVEGDPEAIFTFASYFDFEPVTINLAGR